MKPKKEAGITLISLVVTIIVILIVSFSISINLKSNLELQKILYLRSDIDNLTQKVAEFYNEYGEVPGNIEYTNVGGLAEVLNTVELSSKFYVIDLQAMQGLSLHYGKDYEKVKGTSTVVADQYGDLYIVNEQTHNVFYVQGIQMKENGQTKRQFTNYQVAKDFSGVNVANPPELLTGMQKIMYKDPTNTEKGEIIKEGTEGFDESKWYSYENQKWANAQTEDGSMWVWIPRFAYKFESEPTYGANTTTNGGSIKVKFLIGTSDRYYDDDGNIKTAARQKTTNETMKVASDYVVHPAFTNETSINYANGGWDTELTGIWVAKFEAGYAGGNNKASAKESNYRYTAASSHLDGIEVGETGEVDQAARNWLDGVYGVKNTDGTFTFKGEKAPNIKYPTFQALTYAMNYITPSDAFTISKALTETGNIYGLSARTTDSHLMKNSEWGAVAYLSQSQFGLNGTTIYNNSINLRSGEKERTSEEGKKGVDSVYAVTGVTTGKADGETLVTTIDAINSTERNYPSEGVYTWDQQIGEGASCTGTIYGVYDLSGGLYEIMAAYMANGNETLKNGASFTYNGSAVKTGSTQYTKIYPKGESNGQAEANAQQANYEANSKIYGDAVRETSKKGTEDSSWYLDSSRFFGLGKTFLLRGGAFDLKGTSNGLFSYVADEGLGSYHTGFRAVLVKK